MVDDLAVRLYVDGALADEGVSPRSITWWAGDPRATEYAEYSNFIGYSRSPDDGGAPVVRRFVGEIDDVRVSAVARYSGDDAGVPESLFSDADTVGLWAFDEAAGDVAEDTGPSGSLDGTITGATRIVVSR